MLKRFILFLFFIPFSCFAQVAVTGKVLSHAGNKPVAGASIFLSNTTFGAETSDDGTFTLNNVKPGKYELVITVIGFETYRQKINVDKSPLALTDILVTPKINELKEVVIRVDPKRKRNLDWFYERFKTEFLGTTDEAKDCKILNPEILDIDYDDASATITASTTDFLEIENNALGYKIKYLLTYFKYRDISAGNKEIYFEGPSLFTEMKGTPQQERRWQKKREEVYEGSARHFLRSVLNNQAAQNGFGVLRFEIYHNPKRPPDTLMQAKIELFKRLKTSGEKRYKDSLAYWTKKYELPDTIRKIVNFPINKDDVVEPAGQKGLFALNCNNDWLYITYNKNHRYPSNAALYDLDKPENTENTLMRFNTQDAFFDSNGVISNNAVSFRGVWGRGRVAWLLPTDYDSPRREVAYGDTVLTAMANKFDSYAAARKDEKVYLHLDKSNYGFGDTIWYKAYTVIGQKHQLSALSGVLYVELISPKDSLVTRQSIPLVSGIGWSDIPLAHSLKQGEYRIRAYTRWMQNRPDCIYDQRVRLGGITPAIIKQTEKCDVQFFPEGGGLVNGVRCRVAVKAIGANGLGQDIKGTIEDNTGNVVADFATQHLGMGVFAIMPEAGKSYRAKVNIPGETSFTVDLPKAMEEGYTLSVNNSEKDSLYIKVAVNEQTLTQNKGQTFYIIAQSNGKVYYTTEGKLENTVYTAGIEKGRFPEGITQFTLFNQTGEPLAERIAFIDNPADELNLTIGASSQTYTARDKVKLELTAKDSSQQPIIGSFSVSVINENKVQPDENGESTILNNLLLTSELKGYIEQPNYYFADKSDKAKSDLDVLMLTQGYRRYDWRQVLNNNSTIQQYSNQAIQYQPEPAQELSGTLTTPDGKAIPNGKVTLLATKQNIVRDTTADASGRFTFTDLDITDTATLVVRARKTNNGSNVKIKAFVPDYPKITTVERVNEGLIIADTARRQPAAKQQYSQYTRQQHEDSLKDGKMLNEVTINGKKLPKPDELNNYGALAEYDADMKKLAQEQVVTARALADVIPGLTYSVERGFYYEQKPVKKLIIDGVTATKHDAVDFLSVKDLESVRVIGITPSTLVLTTRRYAGADTMKTAGQLQYSQYTKQQHEDSLKDGKLLKTVTIKGIKKPAQPDLQFSSNLNGPGHADQVIMYDQLGYGPNLSDRLTGKMPGVTLNNKGWAMNQRSNAWMSIIIDGIVMDHTHTNDIAADDVYSIEVLRSVSARSVYGNSVELGGALVITTKRGSETKPDTMKTAGQLQYSQYAKAQHEDSLKNGRMLKTVNIMGIKKPTQPDLQFSSNRNGPGHANQVIMWDQLGGECIDLADCLEGKVPGVKFKDGQAFNIRITNGKLLTSAKKPMRIIVDGVMLDPNASLSDVNASDIYSIEVLRSVSYLAIYGSDAGYGAIIITMKRGNEGTAYFTQAQPNGIMTFPFAGFYKAKAFYTPKYDHPKTAGQSSDLRSTIYWNPNILTDKDGKASIEFYNNDAKGTYRVVVEGIDDDGRLGRTVYRYTVQ